MFGPAYLVVYPLDGGNIHVVGGGAHIFMLLVGEDVDTNQVNLQRKILFNDCSVFKTPVKHKVYESSTQIKQNDIQNSKPTHL